MTHVQAPGTCNVVAQFQEKNLLRLHTGTYVQGTEGAHACNGLGYVAGDTVRVAPRG